MLSSRFQEHEIPNVKNQDRQEIWHLTMLRLLFWVVFCCRTSAAWQTGFPRACSGRRFTNANPGRNCCFSLPDPLSIRRILFDSSKTQNWGSRHVKATSVLLHSSYLSDTTVLSPRDKLFCRLYCGSGLLALAAWCALVVDWMSSRQQVASALVFPLPVTWSAVSAAHGETATALRLYFGMAVSCSYLAATTMAKSSGLLRILASSAFVMASLFSSVAWVVSDGPTTLGTYTRMIVGGSRKVLFMILPRSLAASVYFTVALSLWVLSMVQMFRQNALPLSGFAGFTFLASLMAYCLKDAADDNLLHSMEHKKLQWGLGCGGALQVLLSLLVFWMKRH